MNNSSQVSHGLNLVLRLRKNVPMALVLSKIEEVKPKIAAVLDELNFVHFSRFLPTYDHRALQVITEFDGPLDPYVLDFAIELGDVFDMLLAHTEGTESILPIAEHPAEFLAFVRENNTVRVDGLPAEPDWPVHSAYGDSTVLDIVGPRQTLPMAKADRAATPVQLDDVQGNVLRGFGAHRATHLLFEVLDPAAARAWLAALAAPGSGRSGLPTLTSGEDWPDKQKPEVMLNIGLTANGMKALGLHSSWLTPFPPAFMQGALERAADNFDTGANGPEHWWLGGAGNADQIHIMVTLYQRRRVRTDKAYSDAEAHLLESAVGKLRLIDRQETESRGGEGWLGYVDGIAQPRVAGLPSAGKVDRQPASTAGEFVLGAQYKNIYGGSSLGSLPQELASNGTFCAVRVLAQDPKLFHAQLSTEAKRLGVDEEWLAAKLMGRWFNGAPTSRYYGKAAPKRVPGGDLNDFDYAPSAEFTDTPMDHVGLRCPVGAHIRRGNPRSSRIAGARYARRLMRRGMNYTRDRDGKTEVGLFGLFICADLERQFEFIQRQWINGDRFASGLKGTRDPFGGTPIDTKHVFEIPMPKGEPLRVELEQFVHTRGSLYLFMPGLSALRQIEQFVHERLPGTAIESPSLPQEATWPRALSGAFTGIGATALPLPDATKSLRLDAKHPDFLANPYPVFAKFRAAEPVHYSATFDGWFLFRYKDVARICRAGEPFAAAEPGDIKPPGLFRLDGEPHRKLREHVETAWRPAVADVTAIVKKSIDETILALRKGPADFFLVDNFARPLPRNIYFDILGGTGIDQAKRGYLDSLARSVMKLHDRTLTRQQLVSGDQAATKLGRELGGMLQEAKSSGSRYEGSFLAHLARVADQVDPGNVVTTLVNLTVAGYMSVEFMLATGIRRMLLDDARWWKQLREDHALLPGFLDEMRRCEHALAVVDRFTREEVHFGAVSIPAGKRVFGVLASANRDETEFGAKADEFDPYRKAETPHLGLGHGIHVCMGQSLERQIMRPAIEALLNEMPGLHIKPDAQPTWFDNFYFRSFDDLEVVRN